MRTLILIPYFGLAAGFGTLAIASPSLPAEPTAVQMRFAFEDALTRDVQSALEFALETGGEEALAAIRAKGLDRFTIRAFSKEGCERTADSGGFLCSFSVDIDVVTGRLQRNLKGRFIGNAPRLSFVQDV